MNFLQVPSFLFIIHLFQLEVLCQSNNRLSSIYSTLIEETSLSVRMDEFGQNKILVYYPNGVIRENYRVTGMLWVDEETETIGITFVVPVEQLNLAVDTAGLEEIQSYFEPWSVSFSRNGIGGDLQLFSEIFMPQDNQNPQLLELLKANLNCLESWLTQYDLPYSDSSLTAISEACSSLLSSLGLRAQGLHPASLNRLCSCTNWHIERGVKQGDFWFYCALHSWIIMDQLTPHPMVTCRKPECIIPLIEKDNQHFIELQFPSGQSLSLKFFVEDAPLALDKSQFDAVTQSEGWLPSTIMRADYVIPSSADLVIEFSHFGLPTFQTGDVTFSSQSVIVPKTTESQPYFSAGLLSALGA
jgi:hypothetical protein